MKQSIGLLEVKGLAMALNVSDAMVKAANVTLQGIETAKGGGWMTIKVLGDVASVQAAVDTGRAVAQDGYVNHVVLARPADLVWEHMNAQSEKREAEKRAAAKKAAAKKEAEKKQAEKKAAPKAEDKPQAVVKDQIVAKADAAPKAEVVKAEAAKAETAKVETPKTEAKKSEAYQPKDKQPEIKKTAVKQEAKQATCNLCNDPLCSRVKGEAKTVCMHYKSKK
ncbi:MAG: BMC domain-containing protein [Vibrio sp.]